MITSVSLLNYKELQDSFNKKFETGYTEDNFVRALLSLPIVYENKYEIRIDFDDSLEEDESFVSRVLGCGAFLVEPVDEEDSDEEYKTYTHVKFHFLDRKLFREEWNRSKYLKSTKKNNIKNFSIEFNSKHTTYWATYFENLSSRYLNKTVAEILEIIFTSMDGLLRQEDKIKIVIGDFPEVEIIESNSEEDKTTGLDPRVRKLFENIFEQGSIFDTKKSKLEYNDNKIYLTLVSYKSASEG